LLSPAGGVKTLLTVGWEVEAGAKGGYLCMISGGGSWKFGRFEAADRRAVKLWGFSIAKMGREMPGGGRFGECGLCLR
jgi:hypothetical protein